MNSTKLRLARGIAAAGIGLIGVSSVPAADAPDAQSAPKGTLEEILVTAQKREERLQDVPISLSVLSGDALDRSSDTGVAEALNRVSGVFAPVTSFGARGGGNPTIAIRGVSAATDGPGTTAYYIDGTPFGRATLSFVPDTNPYDLDRVEVLRGPQGTLYGATALNGVVRILTKNPNFQDFEFKARGSLSTTDHSSDENYSGDAAFNVPLIQDKLAARVVLGYQRLGGWIDKPILSETDVNDAEKSSARVKLAAQLSDALSIGVSGWFSRTDFGAPAFSDDGGRTNTRSTVHEASTSDFDSYSLDLGYDGSLVSIKSTTSYFDATIDNNFDFSLIPRQLPGTSQLNLNGSTVLTEELVLSSVGDGPWRWTLGSLYRDGQDDANGGSNLALARDISHIESKSLAIFGELTRAFADGRFEVTGGLRYFRDEVRNWEDSRGSNTTPGGIPLGGLLSIEDTFTKTTPRVVLTWHASQDATLYASYAQGFRSGRQQQFIVAEAYPNNPPADPDTLSNYEIGAKASALDGRLSFDTAVYYMDWQDPQGERTVLINGGPRSIFINGESLSGVGVDLSVTYSPLDALTLGLNVGWNDLTYDSDGVASYPKGTRRHDSPETTAEANIGYVVPLGGGFRGRLSASGNYVSRQITGEDVFTGALLTADPVTVVRLGFTVEAPTHWNATVFVDNATNEKGIQPDESAPGYGVVMRPLTYSLQLEYRY